MGRCGKRRLGGMAKQGLMMRAYPVRTTTLQGVATRFHGTCGRARTGNASGKKYIPVRVNRDINIVGLYRSLNT